jgi:hypothetical protein
MLIILCGRNTCNGNITTMKTGYTIIIVTDMIVFNCRIAEIRMDSKLAIRMAVP